MKTFTLNLLVAFFLLSMVSIADEAKVESSSDTSKNPITGTVTKKAKYKSKHKHGDGSGSETSVTHTTKEKKSGAVEESVEKKTESIPADGK